MLGIRLPLELQLLLVPLLRPLAPPSRLLPAFRVHRHLTVGVGADLFHRHGSSVADEADAGALVDPSSLFEDLEQEYRKVPPSTLDNPPRPRSPTDALVHLLVRKEYADADTLLRDLRATHAGIKPHVLFARNAIRMFTQDRNSPWLAWWAVAHSRPRHPVFEPGAGVPASNLWTEWLCRRLKEQPDSFSLMRDFAAVAAPYGQSRIVARHFLLHFTAYASPADSEELWTILTAASENMDQHGQTLLQRARAGAKWQSRHYQRAQGIAGLEQAVEASTRSQTAFLRVMRNAMVRMHTDMGRLDLAVTLAVPTVESELVYGASSSTLLVLLSASARSNRYDLFGKVYDALHRGGRHLEPHATGRQPPYVVRAGRGGSPSPQEAFVTFRYADFQSEVEEGSPDVPLAHRRNSEGNTAVLNAVAAGDLAQASQAFLQCFEADRFPSLDATAQFIAIASAQGPVDMVATMTKSIQRHSGPWVRGYWATALMLDSVRKGHMNNVLKVFDKSFQLASIPTDFRLAVRRVVGDLRHAGRLPSLRANLKAGHKVHLGAHSFTIAVQALLVKLKEDGQLEAIEDLYRALVAQASTFKFPRDRHRLVSSAADDPSTSLDPYTFLPFLQSFSRDPSRPPSSLLPVFADMASLGLHPQKEHWGVLLGAYALRGSVADLFYLLDTLESRPPSTTPSPELASLLATVRPLPHDQPSLVPYTSVLHGLRKQKEYGAAWAVYERLGYRGLSDTVDAKFIQTVEALRRRAAPPRTVNGSLAEVE